MSSTSSEPSALYGARQVGAGYVVGELRHTSRVVFSVRRQRFEGPDDVANDIAQLNRVLETVKVKRLTAHFDSAPAAISRRVSHAPAASTDAVDSDFAHAGFFQLRPGGSHTASEMVDLLQKSKAVWNAFTAPRPVPGGGLVTSGGERGSRNLQTAQGYLFGPPNGIGAVGAWSTEGGTGRGVAVCDVEAGWNRSHANLPRGIALWGGRLNQAPEWKNHGTAVLGVLVAQPGVAGMMGICNESKAAVQSFLDRSHPDDSNGHHNTAAAVKKAAIKLDPGDILLIELEAKGANGNPLPMQRWADVASAVRFAVSRGVVVVAAAGNGGEDLDDPSLAGTGAQKDYGAIVVGAGCPPSNYFGTVVSLPPQGLARFPQVKPLTRIGTPRSRLFLSNYGRIVSLQGWGWGVASLGYGDAQGGSENRWLTLRFGGTSSATAVVGGAAACLQGCALAKHGRPLGPEQLRELLVRTGSPQEDDPHAPVSQHIGPLPNLERAIRAL